MAHETDPVLKNARREAVVITAAWVVSTVYCCAYSYAFGYSTPTRPLGVADIHPVMGMPSWFLWGVIAPWGTCAAFTFWFAGTFMTDDDLGSDHAGELESDIREGGAHG